MVISLIGDGLLRYVGSLVREFAPHRLDRIPRKDEGLYIMRARKERRLNVGSVITDRYRYDSVSSRCGSATKSKGSIACSIKAKYMGKDSSRAS